MLIKKEIEQLKDELNHCKKPLYLFDDDPDGVSSFLLLYKYIQEGKGVIVKSKPIIGEMFLRKVEEYNPDKIFILDIPMVDDKFKVNVPVIWIDHHEPQETKFRYYNPRIRGELAPTSYLCWQVVRDNIWIAMVGCVGDWTMPKDLAKEFIKEYPDLLDEIKSPEEALFNSTLGKLIKIISFNLKGNTKDVMKAVKILTRIEPREILEHETAPAKFLYKRFEKVNKVYEELLDRAKQKAEDKILVFEYFDDKISLTTDLSNELLYLFPDKVIIVGRVKNGEYKCSIRGKVNLPELIGVCMKDVQGYFGGHENACGACIKEEDFKTFLENMREILPKFRKTSI